MLNDPKLPQQHLVSVLRKIQAGASALLITEEAMLSEAMHQRSVDKAMHQSSVDNDNSHDSDSVYQTDDASAPALAAPPSSSSPAALHILKHLGTSG